MNIVSLAVARRTSSDRHRRRADMGNMTGSVISRSQRDYTHPLKVSPSLTNIHLLHTIDNDSPHSIRWGTTRARASPAHGLYRQTCAPKRSPTVRAPTPQAEGLARGLLISGPQTRPDTVPIRSAHRESSHQVVKSTGRRPESRGAPCCLRGPSASQIGSCRGKSQPTRWTW